MMKATAVPKYVVDHTVGNTITFSFEVREIAVEMGWSTGLGNVLTVTNNLCADRNLISEYGQLSLNDIRNITPTAN